MAPYNIRSISNDVEVKPFTNTPGLIGEAARDSNGNPTFRILFSNLLLTKREVSADTKREIESNNLFFIISDSINNDTTLLEQLALFNRMAIINNAQYSGSKYCRIGIISKGSSSYNTIEDLEGDLSMYPKIYPLRLKDF